MSHKHRKTVRRPERAKKRTLSVLGVVTTAVVVALGAPVAFTIAEPQVMTIRLPITDEVYASPESRSPNRVAGSTPTSVSSVSPPLTSLSAAPTTSVTSDYSSPSSSNSEAPGCTRQFPGDPRCAQGFYYGAAVQGGDPTTLEAKTGQMSLSRSYMSASTSASRFVSRAVADAAAHRIPLISTKLPGSWAAVAAGRYDAWLLERIRGLAKVDGPVWLVLHHEPSGDGPPADWVAMQQHARKLVDANSRNIALVGILNGWDFLRRDPHPEVWRMPVGSGVDVMGFDSYNMWSRTNGKTWRSAGYVLSPATTIASWGYPTVVGEYGVRTDPANPGRAAQWMRDAYNYTSMHSNMVGMSYFQSGQNSPDGTWEMDGERLPVFRANLKLEDTATP